MKDVLSKAHGLGALCLLAWIAIYAVPAFTPEYNQLTVLGKSIRDFLISQGVFLDNASFNAGVLLTVLGSLGKVTDLFRKE